MANNAEYVSTGKGKSSGYAFIAPAGTALPTDASTALSSDYKVLGYISEDGITRSITRDSSSIKDMNGDEVANLQNGYGETWKATFLESLNPEVLKMYYGADNVTVAAGGSITVHANGAELPEAIFVFELIQRDEAVRFVIPRGKITEEGDIVFRAADPVGYDVTIGALKGTNGDYHIMYVA